jgi:hypothetical protein
MRMRTAVGDPYYGVESLEYSGRVSIYTGQLEGSTYSLTLHLVLGKEKNKGTYCEVVSLVCILPKKIRRKQSKNTCVLKFTCD